MTSVVAFRTDASKRIGSGHVHRCLALADALRLRGIVCHFIMRDLDGNLIETVVSRGFPVMALPAPAVTGTGVADGDYRAWATVDEAQDADDTCDVLWGINATDIILDHYGFATEWEVKVRQHCNRVVAIDDLRDRTHSVDVLIDAGPDWLVEKTHGEIHSNRSPVGSLELFGPLFAPMHRTVTRGREVARLHRSRVARILVFYGGSDNLGRTLGAVRALCHSDFRHIAVDVIYGGVCKGLPEILELAKGHGKMDVVPMQASLVPHMLAADLMLGAGGMTALERCALRLPSLTTPIAENQSLAAHALEQLGASRLLDPDDIQGAHAARFTTQIGQALRDILRSSDAYNQMIHATEQVTDSRGAERIAEILFPSDTTVSQMRRADSGDSTILWHWANEASVRAARHDPRWIAWEEHRAWFKHQLKDPDAWIWILETSRGLPLGQFRVNLHDAVGFVDYSIDVHFRGRGLGVRLIKDGLARWREIHPCIPLTAEVLHGNEASARTLSAAGFSRQADSARRSQPAGGQSQFFSAQ